MAEEFFTKGGRSYYAGDRDHARVVTPEPYCYILNLENPETRLEFQLMPDVISESKSAIYNEIPIIGRSLPLLGYGGSSSRAMSLSLSFAALSKEGAGKYTTTWVREQVRWLESKVYPDYLDGYTWPPHRLLIIIGDVIGLQCVMTSVTTSWMGPWDISDERVASPFRAMVDCQFLEFGKNDGFSEHPHGQDMAISGANQSLGQPTGGDQYIDIPLFVREG